MPPPRQHKVASPAGFDRGTLLALIDQDLTGFGCPRIGSRLYHPRVTKDNSYRVLGDEPRTRHVIV